MATGHENASGGPGLFRHDDATNLSNVIDGVIAGRSLAPGRDNTPGQPSRAGSKPGREQTGREKAYRLVEIPTGPGYVIGPSAAQWGC
jgi:hypothetical protein